MSCELEKTRKDFPILGKTFNGKPPIYFDNACMSLKPRQVIEAMDEYYFNYSGCHRRAVHKFGEMTTMRYARARHAVQKFINAQQPDEIIFTKNTTEGINLIARSFPFRKGDVVLTTEAEHNSNLLPWQVLCSTKGIVYKSLPLQRDFAFDFGRFQEILEGGVRLVSIFHTSHITGYALPAKEIIKLSHQYGALVMLDGAQSMLHQKIDVQNLDVDFFIFSFHKMLGPTGVGALYAKRQLLENIPPFFLGGEMVEDAGYDSLTFSEIPYRFEAGLQNYAGAIGAEAAVNYLKKIQVECIQEHELRLNELITGELQNIPKVNLLGPVDPRQRGGIINFYIKDIDAGELSIILDQTENIMVRSGVHCSHALYKKYNFPPTLRISLCFYNTKKEAEIFITTIKKVIKYF